MFECSASSGNARNSVWSGLLVTLGAFAACMVSPQGPSFKPVKALSEPCGVIYVYLPKFIGNPRAVSVVADGMVVGKISMGGYIPFLAPPSQLTISVTDVGNIAVDTTIHASTSKPRFVKLVGEPWVNSRSLYKLVEMSPEQGSHEIQAMQRMEKDEALIDLCSR